MVNPQQSEALTGGIQEITTICTSNAKIEFSDIEDKSILQSEKISVPEIDVVWWMEAVTADNELTYLDLPTLPDISIIIETLDHELVASKNLRVRISVNEVNVSTDINMFFLDHLVLIDRSPVMVGTASNGYQYSPSMSNEKNVFFGKMMDREKFAEFYTAWSTKTSYAFDCSVSFEYLGAYDCHSLRVKGLQQETVLNWRTITSSLYNDDEFADFTFVVQNKQFKVHKCFMAKASEVFKTMFTIGLDETKNNIATINDCDPAIFQILLKFIYKGDWPVTEMPTICMELYEIAHRYNIGLLMRICLEFVMEKKIDPDNALELLEFATTFDIKKLVDSAWMFIRVDMLSINEPCDPKPIQEIKTMLENKKKYDDLKRSFILGPSAAAGEPSAKKLRQNRPWWDRQYEN